MQEHLRLTVGALVQMPRTKRRGVKRKSRRQVRFLLSKVSPLTGGEKHELESELHSGEVKVKKGK